MKISKSLTIKDVAEGLRKNEFSAEEIFDHYQKKIKKENKKFNAYLSTFDMPKGNAGYNIQNELYGVPAAIKDNTLIDGTVCTAGSKILKNYISAYDATVIKKLRSSGASF